MTEPTLWLRVADALRQRAASADPGRLNRGQRAALERIAERLPRNGVLIADEVGMGKTRIAVEVIRAVERCGGRAAILIPAGLGFQWGAELRQGGVEPSPVLRSLEGYLEAWRAPDDALLPWDRYPAVLLSHRFTNWAPRENGEPWRWALLPAVAARLIRQEGGKPGYGYKGKLADPWVQRCADEIADALKSKTDPALNSIRRSLLEQDLCQRASLLSGLSYQRAGRWRRWLECIVGAGLGSFDLVVVDEAHKSRGEESGLTRLLANTVIARTDARRIALTATPVELDAAQWMGTLDRAGVLPQDSEAIKQAVDEYAGSARHLRESWRSDVDGRSRYAHAARHFQHALAPYLLRRDKREDEAVQRYLQHAGGSAIDAYRREAEIPVEFADLSPAWRRAVSAAEALSVVCAGLSESRLKRLRLTVANGHGVAAVLDDDDRQTPDVDATPDATKGASKRLARVEWWRRLLRGSLRDGEGSVFQHPAILTACATIEAESAAGRKVLVFGRYTGPMHALVGLLNAREMLRRIGDGRLWPQAKVHGERGEPIERSDWPAVEAAANQLGLSSVLNDLDVLLAQRYQELGNRRTRFRHALPDLLDQVLDTGVMGSAWRRIRQSPGFDQGDESLLSLLARALGEMSGAFDNDEAWPNAPELADAFAEVMAALADQDSDSDKPDGDGSSQESSYLARLRLGLQEEFRGGHGTFARLMYGSTSLTSRRMMQAAFNRQRSFLRVLVAQSVVGREGLNLHKACRVVVNLHPEWNPAIAEQQIGRVDRVGSLWARECAEAIDAGKRGDELPRIEIRPVVFRGTYDEHHWEVLRERWDDLRAQLHGVVVPTRQAAESADDRAIVDELAACAPNFSPANTNQNDGSATGCRTQFAGGNTSSVLHSPVPLPEGR